MSPITYTATLSQSQGRTGYSAIFRHPVRRDETTGKPGLRIRRGLGTRDRAEAERLCEGLNQLLADTKFHDPAMKAEALLRGFDERLVEMFFDKMSPDEIDFGAIRDEEIPLPDAANDDYRRVLFLGTTGAGKTTVVRQLIGTDPTRERFPSVSAGKTTVHDTEIVIAEGEWRAIVTFVPIDEIREYLAECASAAVLAAHRGAAEREILRRLLNHVNQRYRFSYVLGNGPQPKTGDFDEDEATAVEADDEPAGIDLDATDRTLTLAVGTVRSIAERHGKRAKESLAAKSESDERVADEILEEELDDLVRQDEEFHRLNDSLLDEMEKRFEQLEGFGQLRRTRQGWPTSWTCSTDDRSKFIKAVVRFSGNHAHHWGRLLTPLVNGVRVAGPFRPSWWTGPLPKLVLFDGEGLGHTPRTSSALATGVIRRIEAVDAVVLVDNSTQPMQAAPIAVMRELVTSGNTPKLIFAFTHFDLVEGDNFPTASSRVDHVLASAENVTAALGEDLGPAAERAVRDRIGNARVFLAQIDKPLSKEGTWGSRTISQFEKLLTMIDGTVERPEPLPSRPRYDRIDLVLTVKSAAEAFHNSWFARLGLESRAGWSKEPWQRVKALSRRLASGMSDHYDTLHPVADLRKDLLDRIYVFVQNPIGWTEGEPDADAKLACFDAFADAIAKRLLTLSTRRVWTDRAREWRAAYDERRDGSTFRRARIIGNRIFDPAAPIPDVTPSPARNLFLRDVVEVVQRAADEADVELS